VSLLVLLAACWAVVTLVSAVPVVLLLHRATRGTPRLTGPVEVPLPAPVEVQRETLSV
jgi:hypothetical protein